jgi:DNA polymerase-3 subunit gamma/tau
LEEPPAHVIFILATTEPHKILPTIISRCQRFDFSRLTDEEMIDRMKTVMKEEGKTYDEGALALIAKLANGGMRDALSILEQCLAYNDEHLSEKDVNSIYGIVSLEDKIDLIKVILSKDMNKALEIIEKMDQSGIDVKRLTYDMIDILKDVVIYKNTKNLSILSVLSSGYIDSIVPYITSEDALAFIDLLLSATEKFARSVNPGIYFELAILKLCNQDHAGVVTQIEKAPVPELKPVPDLSTSQERPAVQAKPAAQPATQQSAPVTQTAPQAMSKTQPQPQEDDEIVDDQSMNEPVEEDQPEANSPADKKPEFHFQQTNTVSKATSTIEVDEADILNILVQAKRDILNSCQEKWTVMKRYMANMNTAKAASLLVHGKPVAACPGGMVIAFEYMTDVNAANYYKNYYQIAALIKDVMGEDFRYVAIEQQAWLELRQKFIILFKQHKLPKPGPLILKHIDQVNEKKSQETDQKLTDAQKMALDMFGPDVVEFSED